MVVIEPLKTLLSYSSNPKENFMHYLSKEIREKIIRSEYETSKFYLDDFVYCIRKDTLQLECSGRIKYVDSDRLYNKKETYKSIYIEPNDYYIFVKHTAKMYKKRFMMEQLLKQLS